MKVSGTAALLASITKLSYAQSSNSTTTPPMYQLSTDSYFAFYLEETLSLANNAGAQTGEVLRIASQIKPGDFESVYNAFYHMAEHVHSIATSTNATKDPVTAREAYFRAASYYRGADFFLHGNWSDPRIYSLWSAALNDFDSAIALLDVPAERVNLKAKGSIGAYEVPAVFYKAAPCDSKRPTIIAFSGYDGSQEELYHTVGIEILKRGYNFVSFEGPGQPTVRRQQEIGFIADWWTVTTPVVDYISSRGDVDMERIALTGLSFGGTLAPRAAAYEKRIKAVLAIDGLYSLLEALEQQIPAQLVQLYKSNRTALFDEYMLSISHNASYPSEFRWFIDQGLFAFNTRSATEWWKTLEQITMGPEIVGNLSGVPVFVAKGENDKLTLNEADKAYELLVSARPNGEALTTFHLFETSLGAGEHCALGAEAELARVTLQWLEEVFENVTGVEGTLDPLQLCGGDCTVGNSTMPAISSNNTAFNVSTGPYGTASAVAYTGAASVIDAVGSEVFASLTAMVMLVLL